MPKFPLKKERKKRRHASNTYFEHKRKGSESDIGDYDLLPKFPLKKGKREACPKHSRGCVCPIEVGVWVWWVGGCVVGGCGWVGLTGGDRCWGWQGGSVCGCVLDGCDECG